MTIAWLRPGIPNPRDPIDDTAALIEALAPSHAIDTISEERARDVDQGLATGRFDLCVYELADTPAHQFIWPHLFRSPGILLLRDASLQSGRAEVLAKLGHWDEYAAEFAFNEGVAPRYPLDGPLGLVRGAWPMLRAALEASRLTVVRDASFEADLRQRHPDARLRLVPIGVMEPSPADAPAGEPLRVGILDTRGQPTCERLERLASRPAGCQAHAAGHSHAAGIIAESDVIVVIEWPPRREPPVAALSAMAAGRPTIVLETDATANWPALNPQTWLPRGPVSREPSAVISVDPRDEEHSLLLALRRLVADPELRASLGAAARTWWEAHAHVKQAANAWRGVFAESEAMGDPPRPKGWPAHLSAG
jgi:hypothetical protein